MAEGKPGNFGGAETDKEFLTLLEMLVSGAWVALGRTINPATSKRETDLGRARMFIDMLGALERKTRGNLTERERSILTAELTSLRLSFVDISSRTSASSPAEGGTPADGGEDAAGPRASKAGEPPADTAEKPAEKKERVVEEDPENNIKVVDKRSSTI